MARRTKQSMAQRSREESANRNQRKAKHKEKLEELSEKRWHRWAREYQFWGKERRFV